MEKCRASQAIVLDIWDKKGVPIKETRSIWDSKFVYRVGSIVHPKGWDPNRWNECGGGIHFYITKEEAAAN